MDEQTSRQTQLDNLQTLLGIDEADATLMERMELIIANAEARLKILLGGASEVPEALSYIVTEVAVVRFNRIGSEGMNSHSVEGESISFSDDDFAGYLRDIEAYLDEQSSTKRGRVRFL